MKSFLPLIAFAAATSGCMSFSGLDGSSKFACKAPDGVSCTSVSGIYANPPAAPSPVMAESTASRPAPGADDKKSAAPAVKPYGATQYFHAIPAAGTPLLSPPRILRIWIAPWKDQDGDLRDQSYLYVMWDRGEWNVQHTRDLIRQQYAPVRLRMASPPRQPAPAQAAQAPVAAPDAGAVAGSGVPEADHAE